MHQLSVCLFALGLTLASVEARIGIAGCPYQPVVENFDTGSFMGDWYEYSKYLSLGQAVSGCTKIIYTANGELIDIEVESITLGFTSSRKGQIKKADPASTDAEFTISWFENAFDGRENDKTRVNYQILDTDYTNYAIIYRCRDLLFAHITELYVYTRNRDPEQAVIDGVTDELQDRRLGSFFLTRTSQRNCDN